MISDRLLLSALVLEVLFVGTFFWVDVPTAAALVLGTAVMGAAWSMFAVEELPPAQDTES